MNQTPGTDSHQQFYSLPSEKEAALALLEQLPPEATAHIWLHKPLAVCQAWQAEWQRRWPGVQVHGAYKPLVAWLCGGALAQWQQQPPRQVTLHYPVIEGAHPERFLQEAYPLSGWLAGLGSRFAAQGRPSRLPAEYLLEVDGQAHRIGLPLRWASDLTGRQVLRSTSQVQCGGECWRFYSDTEQVWEAYRQALAALPLPPVPPYFGRLTVQAALCAPDELLDYGHERLSLQEGLAEDLYFGTLEYLQARAQSPEGSRTLQPGQMVPEVLTLPANAAPTLRLRLEPLPPAQSIPSQPLPDLRTLERPLALAEVQSLRPDQVFTSVQGRSVGLWQRGVGAGGLLLTAGQHANEPTGVAAALRFWQELPAQPALPVSCIPLENPDGYALYEALRQLAPEHMHHAARYTALGDDLEYRQGAALYEKAARLSVAAPRLHVNLHGYPAHEWVRPMSGYLPHHFEDWALPKGFFLLLRYAPGHQKAAQSLAQAVTQSLQGHQPLMAFNLRQRAAYEGHTSARPYQLLNGTPLLLQEKEGQLAPLTLITEFPDETVTGPPFRLGVEAQHLATQAAWAWLLAEL